MRPVDRIALGVERVVVGALMVLMTLLVVSATIELGVELVRDIVKNPIGLLDRGDIIDTFGTFLLILIGVELIETIKAYLAEKVVRVEVVIEVALIAIARKVIVLDFAHYDPLTVLAIAALIVALGAAYYLRFAAHRRHTH